MKTLKIFLMAAIAICLASCGGKKDNETSDVTIDDTANWRENEPESEPQTYSSIGYSNESNNDDSSELDDDDDNDSASSSSSFSSSQDWDSLLDSYEQYVDKYITYIKKAANGDMSALSEYPALMEKAQEFGNKMDGAKDDMSAAQWARYMKITTKMTTAMQDMQ